MSELDVVIIGAGPAGLSAGIWARTLGLRYAIVEASPVSGGQLRRVYNRVVDYPGDTFVDGSELADRLARHAESLGVVVQTSHSATAVDLETGIVKTGDTELDARFILLCTGVRPRVLGVPGESEFVGRGVSPSASRYAEQFSGERVLVVGGGDAAFEEALILAEVCEHVTLVHRSGCFRARSEFQSRVAASARIDTILFCELVAIEGEQTVERARLRRGGEEWTTGVGGVFVCAGVVPNSELVAGQAALDDSGYVTVDARFRASHGRLYAAGDVRSGSSLTIAAAVGEASSAVKDIQRRIGSIRA